MAGSPIDLGAVWRTFGISRHFFRDLLKDGDWTFLVKLHDLLENGLAYLLTQYSAREPARASLEQVSNARHQDGSVQLVRQLNLLPNEYCDFVAEFFEFRFSPVHDGDEHSLSMAVYVSSMDRERREKLLTVLRHSGIVTELSLEGALDRHPKHMIAVAIAHIMSCIGRSEGMQTTAARPSFASCGPNPFGLDPVLG